MSFNTSGDGTAVASVYDFQTERTSRIISYNDDVRTDLDADDIPDELLQAVFKSTNVQKNSPIKRETLRQQLADEINTEALGKYHEVRIEDDEVIRPIPPSISSDRERDVWFVSGQSGSGKSTFSSHLLDMYRRANRKIFAITDVPDERFKKVNYLDIHDLVGRSASFEDQQQAYNNAKIRFKHRKKELDPDARIEAEILLNEMKPKPSSRQKLELKVSQDELNKIFEDSVLLLDDYENNKDKHLIAYLRDHLLTKGRHSKTSLIICEHLANTGQNSRLIMSEATNFVMFSKSSPHSRGYLLTKYLGFTTNQVRMITKALKKSRWVSIDRLLDLVLTEKKAFVFRPA